MQIRNRHAFYKPEIMIIPMIDIMFFLLVFFMLSTIYMVHVKTIDVNLPTATQAQGGHPVEFIVSIKKDGSLWLADTLISEKDLLSQAKSANANENGVSVVLRADKDVDYGEIISLMDHLKASGIHRFGLAANMGGKS